MFHAVLTNKVLFVANLKLFTFENLYRYYDDNENKTKEIWWPLQFLKGY